MNDFDLCGPDAALMFLKSIKAERPPSESGEPSWPSALQDPGLRSLDLMELQEHSPEPLGFPWPERAHTYTCVVAIHPSKGGILVDGPEEIRYYCSEVSYDLEEITDIPLDKTEPGVYRAVLKYWATSQYLYGSGETEFEDGFEVVGELVPCLK